MKSPAETVLPPRRRRDHRRVRIGVPLLVALLLFAGLSSAGATPTPAWSDTLATNPDSAQVLLVTTAPDTQAVAPDSSGAKEVHPQDSPVDRGFLIRTADGKSELRIIGSVRLNGIVDFNGLQSTSSFNTFAIPVGDQNVDEVRFQMSAAQTRLGLEASRGGSFGDIFVKVEADFLGDADVLRLRHAYGTIERFLFGKTWSTFGDPSSIPLTVDVDGPNSSVSVRTVQLRYGSRFDSTLAWDAAIESPAVEATIPDSVDQEPSFQSFPDIIGRVRKFGTWGHVQLAVVLRSLSVRDPTGDLYGLAGFGFLVSGRAHLPGDRPHRLLYQFVLGQGVSRYITALSGEGQDLVYNPYEGTMEVTSALGGYISYAREWTPTLLTYLTAGMVRIGDLDIRSSDSFKMSRYFSANLFWDIAPGTRVGAEFANGLRKNIDGQTGNANRFSFLMRYDF